MNSISPTVMGPSPIKEKILKIFGFANSNKNLHIQCHQVPIQLYTNFYFKIEQKRRDDGLQCNENVEDSPDFEIVDFTRHKLTSENIKKVKTLRKSKSVENWLNNLETHQNIVYENENDKNKLKYNDNTEHHYACVDVTSCENLHYYQHQKRLFAKSNFIFESYSSYNVNFEKIK